MSRRPEGGRAIFVAGATAHIALLSTWTLVAFAATDEGFVRFLATTVTVTYALSMFTPQFRARPRHERATRRGIRPAKRRVS